MAENFYFGIPYEQKAEKDQSGDFEPITPQAEPAGLTLSVSENEEKEIVDEMLKHFEVVGEVSDIPPPDFTQYRKIVDEHEGELFDELFEEDLAALAKRKSTSATASATARILAILFGEIDRELQNDIPIELAQERVNTILENVTKAYRRAGM